MTEDDSSRSVPIMAKRVLGSAILWVGLLFVGSLFLLPAFRSLFEWAFPGVEPAVYSRTTFLALWLSHAGLVLASSLVSTIVGVGLAVFVTRGAGREFRAAVDSVAGIGQTFPPTTVLAVAVPIVGFGVTPTLIALMLYGLLPIVENAIAGFEGVSPAVLEAGAGMGLSRLQLLWRVELPLAAPLILSGVRTSVIVNIGTATIGSTVGALTLGTPIISGLVGEKMPYVIQGTIVVGLFAILTDLVFERLDQHFRSRRGG
ncbi:MAG: ABC transporter permease [Aliidongia sp.]